MALTISPARSRDLPDLTAIERSATELYYEAGFSRARVLPRDEDNLRALLSLTTTLLAREGEEPIGYVSYYPRGPFMVIEELGVRRDRQRRGCGRALAQQVLAAAGADPQCEYVALVAYCRAAWGLGLYERLGFLRLAEVRLAPEAAGLLPELFAAGGDDDRQIMVRPVDEP